MFFAPRVVDVLRELRFFNPGELSVENGEAFEDRVGPTHQNLTHVLDSRFEAWVKTENEMYNREGRGRF